MNTAGPAPAAAATLTIGAANPLEHAREIKELFLAHERPEFPDFFDRTYPQAVAQGATSWLGRDPAGRLVMHIARLPRRFRFGDRDVTAGLLANLVVATPHRSFFPALALVHRLVTDSRAGGGIDFLYADPNAESRALLRGIHFAPVGTLRRYVLPVRDRRAVMDVGVRLFHALTRAAGGAVGRAPAAPESAARLRAEPFATPPFVSPRLAAYHDRALYVSRLRGYPGDRDWWLVAPEIALLLRGPDASGLAAVHAVRRGGGSLPRLGAVVPALVAELRRRGAERVQVMTVAESDLGRALRRCGFMARRESVPLFALPLTPLGESCVRSVKDWEITDIDCDR